MIRAPASVLVALVLALAAPAPVRAESLGKAIRRFALVVGNNQGGSDTRPLLYAADDARKVHAVLTELGGVRREDAALLLDRSADELMRALVALETRALEASRQGQRTALFVYYSGHAKEGALRLGNSRLPIDQLKQRLAAQHPIDVRVGIFDACRSGVVNRTKGARKGPAFEVEAAGAHDTRGLVLLTSSSADEDAQESDALAGSYFSHHLVSGLRGSADRSADRRVTLSEAYEYAYARTVAETADTAAGAQHPTFSYDLKGNGNLVLSELGLGREGLYLPAAAPAGMYYLVDAGRGVVAAEVMKGATGDRLVALGPGRYKVKRRLADRLRIGEVQVPPGRFVTLDEAALRDAPFSDDPVKGARAELASRYNLSVGATMQAFLDADTRNTLFPPTGLLALELQLRHFFRRDWVSAVDLALGGSNANLVTESAGAPLPFRFSELNLGLSLFAEWPLLDGRLTPFVGGRLAYLLMSRKFEGEAAVIPDQFLSTFSPGVLGGLRLRLGGGFSATARTRIHYLQYNVEDNRSLGYWELGAVLAYDL